MYQQQKIYSSSYYVFLKLVLSSLLLLGVVWGNSRSLFLGRKVKPSSLFQSLIFLFWCVCRLFVWLPPPPPNINKVYLIIATLTLIRSAAKRCI